MQLARTFGEQKSISTPLRCRFKVVKNNNKKANSNATRNMQPQARNEDENKLAEPKPLGQATAYKQSFQLLIPLGQATIHQRLQLLIKRTDTYIMCNTWQKRGLKIISAPRILGGESSPVTRTSGVPRTGDPLGKAGTLCNFSTCRLGLPK